MNPVTSEGKVLVGIQNVKYDAYGFFSGMVKGNKIMFALGLLGSRYRLNVSQCTAASRAACIKARRK
jgi:hypothetical protein